MASTLASRVVLPEALVLAGACIGFVAGWQAFVMQANAVETNGLLLVTAAGILLSVAPDQR